jgi:hypothetical protein
MNTKKLLHMRRLHLRRIATSIYDKKWCAFGGKHEKPAYLAQVYAIAIRPLDKLGPAILDCTPHDTCTENTCRSELSDQNCQTDTEDTCVTCN